MCHSSRIVRDRQKYIRRECDRRQISMKAVSGDSKIPYATLLTYFPADADIEPAQIPGGAIFSLISGKALPDELISMLLPDEVQIVRPPQGVCLDTLEEDFLDFLKMKAAAHHPESGAGREISENEKTDLLNKVTKISEAV